jgi:hypothetical protein
MPQKTKLKLTDEELVAHYMKNLKPPLSNEVEKLRKIIKSADKRINERIKWNAPSYYYKEDFLTFGPYREGKILLVFHHASVVKIKSDLLQGEYSNRRLLYLSNMNEIKKNKNELVKIIREIISTIK